MNTKLLKQHLIVLVVLILFTSSFIVESVYAQKHLVVGFVNDSTGKSISNIEILIRGTNLKDKTNLKGKFKITVPDSIKNIEFLFPSGYSVINSELDKNSNYNIVLSSISVNDLVKLSLDELLSIKIIAGTISEIESSKSPASITTINQNDIEQTPVRNLFELLEVYVPGVSWYTNTNSYTLAMRGVFAKQNNKFILMVNGKNMNLKTTEGMASEIENWDLNDIDKIEVIRGPGSVTYGPGAVGGIINIITKSANTGIRVNAFDPGLVPGTGLARTYPSLLKFVWRNVMPVLTYFQHNTNTAKLSGKRLANLAYSEQYSVYKGKYFEGAKEIQSSTDSYNQSFQNELWKMSIELVGIKQNATSVSLV